VVAFSLRRGKVKKTQRPNRPSWDHGQKTVTVPGTAQQLPDLVVPDSFELVVRALPGNTGNIYLGKSQEKAESATDRLTFSKGNGITLKVKNADLVWVYAAVDNEGVDYWVEV